MKVEIMPQKTRSKDYKPIAERSTDRGSLRDFEGRGSRNMLKG